MTGVFDDLASVYEAVASLSPVGSAREGGSSGQPGSSVPPGAHDLLELDEYQRAVAGVDDIALFAVRLLIEEVPGIGAVPDETPGRLRLAGHWVEDLAALPDARQAAELLADARWHLVGMRRLARRGDRQVRTGSMCLHVTCRGQYVVPLDEVQPDAVCSVCRDRVGYGRWSKWSSRAEWVTVEHAMSILGVASKHAVWSRAKRERWRRRGEGREVRYHVDDVRQRVTAWPVKWAR